VPTTDEERLLLAPPSANRDVSGWEDEPGGQSSQPVEQTDELEEFRRRLENLL